MEEEADLRDFLAPLPLLEISEELCWPESGCEELELPLFPLALADDRRCFLATTHRTAAASTRFR